MSSSGPHRTRCRPVLRETSENTGRPARRRSPSPETDKTRTAGRSCGSGFGTHNCGSCRQSGHPKSRADTARTPAPQAIAAPSGCVPWAIARRCRRRPSPTTYNSRSPHPPRAQRRLSQTAAGSPPIRGRFLRQPSSTSNRERTCGSCAPCSPHGRAARAQSSPAAPPARNASGRAMIQRASRAQKPCSTSGPANRGRGRPLCRSQSAT